MQSIQNALLTTIQKHQHLTAIDAIKIAGCGQVANVTRMREQGFLEVNGVTIDADRSGHKRQMYIYNITPKGVELLERMANAVAEKDPQRFVLKGSNKVSPSRKPRYESYTPRQRDPHEALGVQFAPMFQPAYVPPRWESVR